VFDIMKIGMHGLQTLALISLVTAYAIPPAKAADFGRMIKISGDRQIVVGPLPSKGAPFSVRTMSSEGTALSGVAVHIQSSDTGNENVPPDFPCAFNADEFGYFGFFAGVGGTVCGNNGAVLGFSDAQGMLTLTSSVPNEPPAAFLIGAKASVGNQQGVPAIARTQFFTVVRAVNPPAGQPVVVVEYFHDGYRNYFNTINQAEIDGLDAGVFAGWTREVGGFIAWPSQAAAPAGAVPVCRFFASVHTSHFYTADPVECDAVIANFPEWQLETREAYWIVLPDKATGACGEGLMPVYRVLKPSRSNHRYVTDRTVRDTMVAAGWIAEGYGTDAVIMCTPR
jgi:hypothetical protein